MYQLSAGFIPFGHSTRGYSHSPPSGTAGCHLRNFSQIYPYTLPPRGSINLAIFLCFIRSWTQYCISAAKIHFFIETTKKNWDFLSKRRKGKYMRAIKDEIWASSSFLKQVMQDSSSNKKLMVGDDYLLNLSVCCFSRLTSQ